MCGGQPHPERQAVPEARCLADRDVCTVRAAARSKGETVCLGSRQVVRGGETHLAVSQLETPELCGGERLCRGVSSGRERAMIFRLLLQIECAGYR